MIVTQAAVVRAYEFAIRSLETSLAASQVTAEETEDKEWLNNIELARRIILPRLYRDLKRAETACDDTSE